MKRALVIFVLLITTFLLGIFLGSRWAGEESQPDEQAGSGERKVLYWVAPMDPNYRRDAPGKSPMGMDLEPVYEDEAATRGERKVLYWVAPMDPNYRRDAPGKSPMGMDLEPVYEDEAVAADAGVVRIDPRIVNNLGVRTALVASGSLSYELETVGHVSYDEDSFAQVNTRTDGWIEKLAIKSTGEPVSAGQLLFELYSPTLVNAQEEYLAALGSRNEALIKASRARLEALGVGGGEIKRLEDTRQVRQRAPVYAQVDGVVAQLAVREGQFVTPAKTVMIIASLDTVWVLADVLERQSGLVSKGQSAEMVFDSAPGQRRAGEVDYVYPELDPVTRSLKVRLRMANDDGALRPNMLARVSIKTDAGAAVVHVPRSSVIRGASGDRVVLSLGDGQFRSKAVVTGRQAGERVEIRSGLSAGQRVVTSGQFLIDSESNVEQALERYEGVPPDHDHASEGHSTGPGQ